MELSNIKRVLPPVTDPRGTSPCEIFSFASPFLVSAHFGIHACQILLFEGPAADDRKAHDKVLRATHEIAILVRCLRQTGCLGQIHSPAFVIVRRNSLQLGDASPWLILYDYH